MPSYGMPGGYVQPGPSYDWTGIANIFLQAQQGRQREEEAKRAREQHLEDRDFEAQQRRDQNKAVFDQKVMAAKQAKEQEGVKKRSDLTNSVWGAVERNPALLEQAERLMAKGLIDARDPDQVKIGEVEAQRAAMPKPSDLAVKVREATGHEYGTAEHRKAMIDAMGLGPKKTKAPSAEDLAKTSDNLRRELQGLPISKDMQAVDLAAKKLAVTSDTGAGDISLIFGYMKLLDPQSTVREGEFATASEAGGSADKLLNAYNKAINGERLTPQVRQQFREEANKLLGVYRSQFSKERDRFRGMAKKRGADPDDVYRLSADEATEGLPPLPPDPDSFDADMLQDGY